MASYIAWSYSLLFEPRPFFLWLTCEVLPFGRVHFDRAHILLLQNGVVHKLDPDRYFLLEFS